MSTTPGFAVIDLETTGFSASDRIIEIGLVLLDSSLAVESTWDTLVQPNRDIPNSFVHGITATDVVKAPAFGEVAPQLAGLLTGRIPVAHNASFERRFLTMEFRRAGVDTNVDSVGWTDTQALSKRILGCAKLEQALAVVGIENARPHAALADALATAELLGVLAREYGASVDPGSRVVAEPAEPAEAPRVGLLSRTLETAKSKHWLAGLADNLPSNSDADVERYRKALAASLVDRSLSASEIAQLSAIAVQDGLSFDDIALIHEDFIRQLAVTAWLDGVVTNDERAELTQLARQLGVADEVVDQLLAAPVGDGEAGEFRLRPGDRVAFTGSLDLPRAEWERRVVELGLSHGAVTKKTVVVVAGNPDSMSGKAARARELMIPIVSEVAFTRLIAAFEGIVAAPAEDVETSGVDEQRFPWLLDVEAEAQAPDEVALAWISHKPDAPLHHLSPGLSVDSQLELAHSSIAAAGQRWRQLYPRMLEATVYDLRSLQGVGEKRVRRLVEAVILAALDTDESAEQDSPAVVDDMGLSSSIYLDGDTYRGPREDVDVVAGWAALTGEPFPGTGREKVVSLFSACVAELVEVALRDERMLEIATQRWLGDATLEELGAQFGVSRERVRQLETKARDAYSVNSELSEATARAISRKFGRLILTEQAQAELPELWNEAVLPGTTFEQYFRKLYTLWDVNGRWIHAPGVPAELTTWIDGNIDTHGIFSTAAAAKHLDVDQNDLRELLLEAPSFFPLSDEEMARATNYQDRAVAVLAHDQHPMSLEDIAAHFRTESNIRSVANQLAVDPRITRVALNSYALTEWGMEEFSTISDWIARRIDDSPTGAVALSELLADAPQLGVSETSVRAYASSIDFRMDNGMVRRAVGDEEVIEDGPEDSKNMYLRGGTWRLLIAVTADHLRGSGFQVPRGAVGLYHVPVGGEVEVPSRLGGQFLRVNKLRQPSTSTIRRFLQELGSKEGDRVWLTFGPELFDVSPAPDRDSHLRGLARLLNEMGLDTALASDADAAMREVNLALGLSGDAPRRRSAAIFGHRGQDELADIIRSL
ncbi:exonuclease domain-containing protein [Corynebacterium sanguinis]|uniref:exonuclease domain-containing protein n=1 Tax=Corynebacterium sanguinis TaxID=2594913 RepID=UPI001184F714|nr:exonuclease domain-containing protein [Corynebacterium sanguinis]MCT1613830.1 exonuclease domain-containing protein [Corynebacterium sanguinis]MCT1694672.1 exonuclease domain-containing protein [Corynebacterium sanguinis]MCT1714415.1 exonuclease domain-containing protein [Corynebacterium sanguinis]MCT1805434.1 exonuclease domain-containing protein [Corynebacterium sanguinis]MCT2159023.1 exonuclease domain-containing protein [Corynebacterium sanguinis]